MIWPFVVIALGVAFGLFTMWYFPIIGILYFVAVGLIVLSHFISPYGFAIALGLFFGFRR